MALADDIRELGTRTEASLGSLHDYYTHTKIAWKVVRTYIKQGNAVVVQNQTTGTSVGNQELLDLAGGYISGQLATATFKDLVPIFEDFLFGLLRLRLIADPRSLSSMPLKFEQVLKSSDLADLTAQCVDWRLNEWKYKTVVEWFRQLEELMKLGVPTATQIERIAEIKASRDILEHNQGVVNETYLRKAGPAARYAVGQQLEIPEHYHRESWELLRDVVRDITNAAVAS